MKLKILTKFPVRADNKRNLAAKGHEEMGDIDKVCDDYSVYVDKLEAMSKKEKKKFLDEKFEKRLLPKKEKKGIAKLFG